MVGKERFDLVVIRPVGKILFPELRRVGKVAAFRVGKRAVRQKQERERHGKQKERKQNDGHEIPRISFHFRTSSQNRK